VSRFPSIALTALSAYVCAHLQFGIAGYWGLTNDEFDVLAACLVAGSFAFGVFKVGERLVGALVSPKHLAGASTTAVIVLSLCLGLLFYSAFLPRNLVTALTRDLPFVLCFALLAVGYLAGRAIEAARLGRGSHAQPVAGGDIRHQSTSLRVAAHSLKPLPAPQRLPPFNLEP